MLTLFSLVLVGYKISKADASMGDSEPGAELQEDQMFDMNVQVSSEGKKWYELAYDTLHLVHSLSLVRPSFLKNQK